jgi:hypothetical protein
MMSRMNDSTRLPFALQVGRCERGVVERRGYRNAEHETPRSLTR